MSRKFNLEAGGGGGPQAGYSAPFGDEEGTIEVRVSRPDGTHYTLIQWSEACGAVFTVCHPEESRKALAAYDAILERLKVELPKGWHEMTTGPIRRTFHASDSKLEVRVNHSLIDDGLSQEAADKLHKLADWLADQ